MVFVRLGWRIVRRNVQRSLLAVVSLAFATATFASAAVLAVGAPGGAFATQRRAIGGDILVLPYHPARPGTSFSPQDRWVWARIPADVTGYYPQFHARGLLRGMHVREGQERVDLSRLADALALRPEVSAVHAVRALPGFVQTGPDGRGYWVRLVGRDPALDEELGFSALIIQGRPLTKEDAGSMVVLVDGFVPLFTHRDDSYFGYDRYNGRRVFQSHGEPVLDGGAVPPVGTTVVVEVPQIRTTALRGPSHAGQPSLVLDYANPTSVHLRVAGHYAWPTSTVPWAANVLTLDGLAPDNRVDKERPRHFPLEQRVWTSADFLVPAETLERIAQNVGATSPLEPVELATTVKNFGQVTAISERLQATFPEATFITVPDLVRHADLGPEPLFQTPPEDLLALQAGRASQITMRAPLPGWSRGALVALAYLSGGLLFAGNVYILLAGRKHEMAVLKALGAKDLDVVISVITEVGALALAGGILGLGIMLPLALWQWVSNGLDARTMLGLFGNLLVTAVGFSILSTLAFGGGPALWAARRPPTEVLRNG